MRSKYAPHEGLEPATLRLKVWCSTDWANRAPQITWGDYNYEKSFPKQMFETIENVSAMNNGILFNIKSTFKHLVTTQEGGWSLFKCK